MSDGPTVSLDAGGDTIEWDIATITDGPEGKYLLLDSDGQPRLIVDGDELAELQDSVVGGRR